MNYYYAKIGKGNSLADEYLRGDTHIQKPAIPIFFDCKSGTKDEFLRNGGAKEQGRNFFLCEENPENSFILVIHQGKLYVVCPEGEVVFWKCQEDTYHLRKNEYIKLLPIRIILEKYLSEVPAILSSMTANAYYYTGTFRKIGDQGNIRAIQSVLEKPLTPFNYDDPKELLHCLSSIELETLIAKLFEEAGCFVPAYRGGAIKDIDIFAKNFQSEDISIGRINIPANSAISIQVKRGTNLKNPVKGCDYLLSTNNDANDILSLVKKMDNTRQWLKHSLSWLPNSVLADYGVS